MYARARIPGLRFCRYGADLDVTKAERAERLEGGRFLIEPSREPHRIGKLDPPPAHP